MKFSEYIKSRLANGPVDMDGYYGFQCMDLWNEYCKFLGLTGNTGADCAKNILNNKYVMENFERIDNYLEFVPKKGDIAVWTGGKYGHVAICLGEGDINSFKTLDQNWKPQQLTEEVHNYTYMAPLVFLRPKNQSNIIEEINTVGTKYKVGQKVRFSTCYRSSMDPIGMQYAISAKDMARDTGTITKINEGSNNPYLLDGGLCWVNDGDIREVLN